LGRSVRKLVGWVEESIEETFTFYRLPRQHHKHLKSTNMLERLNGVSVPRIRTDQPVQVTGLEFLGVAREGLEVADAVMALSE
jgi:hypothetical protein